MITRTTSTLIRTAAFLGAAAAVALGGTQPGPGAEAPAADGGLVVRDDFEAIALDQDWDFTDRAAWRLVKDEGRESRVLDLFQASKYEPPVRSPFNIALRKGGAFERFTLDVTAKSTTRDYGHRDLCFIFGYVDPTHFYYVHLANAADEHANSIFKVDGAARVSIAEKRTKGTRWDDGWHHVRIKREPSTGLIEVYFDDLKTPVMSAHDTTFGKGRIGLGSFDDTGRFDDLAVTAAAPR